MNNRILLMYHYFLIGIKELLHNRRHFYLKLDGYVKFFLKSSNNIPHPLNYQIEPSSSCNLACKMCAVKKDHSYPSLVTINNFKKIYKNLLPVENLNISGLGEPLLNTQLEEYIKIFSKTGTICFTISNGMLLSTIKIKKLSESGLKSISISLESVDSKTYESIRTNAKFSQLKTVLKLLQSQKNIQTLLNIVLFKNNLSSYIKIKKFIDFASNYDISNINCFVPDNVIETNTLKYFQDNNQKIIKTYSKLKKYAHSKNININLPSTNLTKGICTSPWLFPFITVSGDVLPCCGILHLGLADGKTRKYIIKKYSFGNIFDNKIDKVWNTQKAISFRNSFQNKTYNPYCLRCSKFYMFK